MPVNSTMTSTIPLDYYINPSHAQSNNKDFQLHNLHHHWYHQNPQYLHHYHHHQPKQVNARQNNLHKLHNQSLSQSNQHFFHQSSKSNEPHWLCTYGQFQQNCLISLASMLLCPHTILPIMVGLFSHTNSQTDYMQKLKGISFV